MADTATFGRHSLRCDGELVSVKFVGTITRADAVKLREVLNTVFHSEERCFLLANMREGTGIDPEARKYMAEWSKTPSQRMAGTAVFGMSFAARAIVMLMVNAIKVLGNLKSDVTFVKDEAEAREWIERQRARKQPGSMHVEQ